MKRLLLFAKRPRRGKVKTRLAPLLGERLTLELYRACLSDQIGFLRSLSQRYEVELWIDGAWSGSEAGLPDLEGLTVRQQGEGNLGRRLERAFEQSCREGATATVVIGADSPTLPERLVTSAFRALDDGCPAVLSPATDGGYVLIGLRRPAPTLFRGMPWGGPEIARLTRERAAESGLRMIDLEPWYDVDDRTGLERLRRDLAHPEIARRAPRTARIVRTPPGLSV